MRLVLELDDINYDALIDQFLPLISERLRQSDSHTAALLGGLPTGAAAKLLRGLPAGKKEKLTAELVNANTAELSKAAEEFGAEQGLHFTVRSLHAIV